MVAGRGSRDDEKEGLRVVAGVVRADDDGQTFRKGMEGESYPRCTTIAGVCIFIQYLKDFLQVLAF